MTAFTAIADDLTGAADTAVEFRHLGPAYVMVSPFPQGGLPEAGVYGALAVHTASRNLPPELMRFAVGTAYKLLSYLPRMLTYMKVDSNLRGNIGLQLAAALEAGLGPFALLCPAFPARRRTVSGGVCRVDGVPVAETEMGRDPVSPVPESHAAKLVSAQLEEEVGLVGLAQLRAGLRTLKKSLLCQVEAGRRVIVADAETNQDLRRLARAALSMKRAPSLPESLPTNLEVKPSPAQTAEALEQYTRGILRTLAALLSYEGCPLLAGSAGLAREVAALVGLKPKASSAPRAKRARLAGGPRRKGPVLVAVGSASQVSAAQVCYLAEHTTAAVIGVPRPSPFVELPKQSPSARQAQRAARAGQHAVLTLAPPDTSIENLSIGPDPGPETMGIVARRSLGLAVPFVGMVISGGDTACEVLCRLRARAVRLMDSLEPGVAAGRLVGGFRDGLPVVLKAGAAGGQECLARAIAWVQSQGEGRE